MSKLLGNTIKLMQDKQSTRMKSVNKKASERSQTSLGTITGYDSSTGAYIATTPDGGENYVQLGNFGEPPTTVSIITTQGSSVQFADFRAPQ
jgi:hypothetical protein